VYAAITAIEALDQQGIGRPRCVGLIETSEESGSPDLPAYIAALNTRLGNVGLVVCLDSGAGNYDQLWLTTSLRGMVSGVLKVEILTEGIHSGDASGLVPSSFRILRQVLDRLEDSQTGQLLPESFHCQVPARAWPRHRPRRPSWATRSGSASPGPAAPMVGPACPPPPTRCRRCSTAPGAHAERDRGRWLSGTFQRRQRAAPLHRLQAEPAPAAAGGRPPGQHAAQGLLEDNAPYNAKVTFQPDGRAGALGATGWDAPELAPWLEGALNAASQSHFGAPVGYIGQGGTIPLMSMLAQGFPKAQMMVCGVLGPKSNAHGPNEFLHVPYGKKLTAAVAQVISACP
jgi:acetylornithine deacetylase/succinyl-diaminopimelate desuccinylase-like protein